MPSLDHGFVSIFWKPLEIAPALLLGSDDVAGVFLERRGRVTWLMRLFAALWSRLVKSKVVLTCANTRSIRSRFSG